jgi:integrase
VFTGARVAEILGLRWDWVNFERSEARLPDSKTGAKTIHLAPPALAILAALPRVDGNPHVIVGAVEGEPLINLEKPWRTIRSRAAVKLWQKDSRPEIAGLAAELAAELGREPSAALCAAAAKRREIELPVATLDLRLHDLRHCFASIAAASGMGLPIIGKMLGHTEARSTQRYAHVAPDPVKAAAAAVAGKIAGAMQGGGEVVEFKK